MSSELFDWATNFPWAILVLYFSLSFQDNNLFNKTKKGCGTTKYLFWLKSGKHSKLNTWKLIPVCKNLLFITFKIPYLFRVGWFFWIIILYRRMCFAIPHLNQHSGLTSENCFVATLYILSVWCKTLIYLWSSPLL